MGDGKVLPLPRRLSGADVEALGTFDLRFFRLCIVSKSAACSKEEEGAVKVREKEIPDF